MTRHDAGPRNATAHQRAGLRRSVARPTRWLSAQSLRTRLILTNALLTGAAVLLATGLLALFLQNVTLRHVDADLSAAVTAARGGADADGDADLAPGITVRTLNGTGTVTQGPALAAEERNAVDALLSRSADPSAESPYALTRDDVRYLLETSGDGSAIVASENMRGYEQLRTVAVGGFGVAGLLLTLTSAYATRRAVDSALAPVRAMTNSARTWSRHDLDHRFYGAEPTGSDEFGELARTFDELLDRVAQAMRDERRLTSELAHELRTPLTVIRGEAELALLADPSLESQRRIIAQVERLSGTISTLLAASRGSVAAPVAPTALREVLAHFADDAAAGAARLVVEESAAALEVRVQPDLLERVLAPLIDNARRYARATVTISAVRDGGRVRISVSDDGAGLADDPGLADGQGLTNAEEIADGEAIADGGRRAQRPAPVDQENTAAGDDPTQPSSPTGAPPRGAGLGLPLARRIAEMLGGSVEVTSRRNPTTFTVNLPG